MPVHSNNVKEGEDLQQDQQHNQQETPNEPVAAQQEKSQPQAEHAQQFKSSEEQHADNEDEIIDVEALQKKRLEEENAKKEQQRVEEKARKRIEVLREILSTETTYVKNLKILEKEYLLPIKNSLTTRHPLLKENDYQTIFMDIEVIVKVNSELHDFLKNFMRLQGLLKDEVAANPNSKYKTIGSIFYYMHHYLRSYNTYCNNYNNIFKIIEEQKKKSKNFKKFMDGIEFSPQVGFQTMISFMITPVQRIPRYNLLLNELLKYTPNDQEDYSELVKANEAIKKVAILVNERLRDSLNQERCVYMSQIISRLNFELVQPQRRFAKEGLVCCISSNKGIGEKYLILFNDLLLITNLKRKLNKQEEQDGEAAADNSGEGNNTSASPATASSQQEKPHDPNPNPAVPTPDGLAQGEQSQSKEESTKQRLYRLTTAVPLKEGAVLLWFKNLPDTFVMRNAFQIVSEKKTWTVFCKTAEDKQEWLTTFQNIQQQLFAKNPQLEQKPKASVNVPKLSITSIYLDPANNITRVFKKNETSAAMARRKSKDYATAPLQAQTPEGEGMSLGAQLAAKKKRSSFSKVSEFLTKKFAKKNNSNDIVEAIVSDNEEIGDEEEVKYEDLPGWMKRLHTRLDAYKEFYMHSSSLTKLAEEYKPIMQSLADEEFTFCVQNPLFGQEFGGKISDSMLEYYEDMKRVEEASSVGIAVHMAAASSNSVALQQPKRSSLFFK